MGHHIRMAYADSLHGPWKIHEPAVLQVKDTAFYRPQPDRVSFRFPYTHIASPEVVVDDERTRIVMYSHGYWTEGKPFPNIKTLEELRTWKDESGYWQSTQPAVSNNGLDFKSQPGLTRQAYMRVIPCSSRWLGMARGGVLYRTEDLLTPFDAGPSPFEGTDYEKRVRHVALLRRGNLLYIFFSAQGDAPERILATTITMDPDWTRWKISTPFTVLTPEKAYECVDLPVEPSIVGDISEPARQLRDPAVFEDAGKTYLLYTICGEQGIAAAELTLP